MGDGSDYIESFERANDASHCWHCVDCFKNEKDVLIPSLVDKWSTEHLMESDQKLAARTYLACYHGSDSSSSALYRLTNASVRDRLQELSGAPWTSIGRNFPVTLDYYRRLGQSLFCFVPKGGGTWTM